MSKARERMLSSVAALTGENQVDEAVLIQQRPVWVWIPAVAMFIVVAVIAQAFGMPAVLGAGLGGGLLGAVYAILTKYFVVASAGSSVYLCRSKAVQAQAIEVLATFTQPVEIPIEQTIVNDKIRIGGQEFISSRAFRSRLDTIRG